MEEYLKFLKPQADTSRKPFDAGDLGPAHAEAVRAFHKTLPGYASTPLVKLSELAKLWNVEAIYVKDESPRFGLNAFKVLGGSYAIATCIAEVAGIRGELSYEKLTSPEVHKKAADMTFVTATDGNHGRGIAWAAGLFGSKSVVYLPKGSSPERLSNIRALGAQAAVTDMNYDDTVLFAREQAVKNGWILVQDTTLDDYEKIPRLIMEGYTALADEIREQLNGIRPTHIFLQAGVGSFAGAVAGYFSGLYAPEEKPFITIVEPFKADCLFRTARAADGTLHTVTGDMNTIMAGLACGKPCSIGWKILESYADVYVAIPEYIAAQGMRILGAPAGDDSRIISGESGAAAFGFFSELMTNSNLRPLHRDMEITGDSRFLFISTEGDTDRQSYRHIVWNGHYPHPIPPVRKKNAQ